MLELPILAVFVTCIAGMIKWPPKKRKTRPIWERETRKEEMEKWLVGFLAKLKRTSTRSQECRIILSVERMEFEDDEFSYFWRFVQFGDDEGEIFDSNTKSYQKIKLREFQKLLLKTNTTLKNQLLDRSKIKEENGKWDQAADFYKKVISDGGEALVFSENFGDFETAVRIQIFDPFLFTNDFGFDSLSWKIHFEEDFKKAIEKEESVNEKQMPKHENVIRNLVNIELFHKKDSKKEDCLGWITIMDKADEDLRTILKEEKIDIDERKKTAEGVLDGFIYLSEIGIYHFDVKFENILMLNGIPKIIDFGLICEETGRNGYREMGYARRGSRFRNNMALCAGTSGFARFGRKIDKISNSKGPQCVALKSTP